MTPAPPQMTLISEGEFVMGSDAHAANEAPAHAVWVDAFAIAVYAVTNADYARFLDATDHTPPPTWRESSGATARRSNSNTCPASGSTRPGSAS